MCRGADCMPVGEVEEEASPADVVVSLSPSCSTDASSFLSSGRVLWSSSCLLPGASSCPAGF